MNKSEFLTAVMPVLSDLHCELWSSNIIVAGGITKITLLIDKINRDERLSLDDCAEATRLIRPILDVEFNLDGNYQLEISSPGIARTLHTVSQMRRYIGEKIKVKLYMPIDNQKQFQGVLKQADEETLILEESGNEVNLSMSQINKVNLVGEV